MSAQPAAHPARPYTRATQLPAILAQRIVILDGAMGTMIQRYKLTEADYRGERFKEHHKDLKGNNDLLVLTKPEVIREQMELLVELSNFIRAGDERRQRFPGGNAPRIGSDDLDPAGDLAAEHDGRKRADAHVQGEARQEQPVLRLR